ncbi:serine/threonine-protein kinase [Leifsonia virtsii]|uniref:non-specific serine/threonine protein kinase n=1 Tax=Leifsonia virtsii TaxID=3035915 RepID=A0ABT8IW47_9MICO|nr:serine/threonine-protein kinase [Leifsonia virtsii]MDN4597036.1 serine/threonine-protein kinase [Leifsonia virtsii]
MDERVLLDRYELRDRLGRGGMATVFRAFDRRLERDVAVKLFAQGTAVDDARRRTEATMLARLSHPHLVGLHDAHLAADGDSTPSFLVMELVDGEDLRTRLEDGPLHPEDAVEVLAGIAEALVVVHEAGMVHRDLKPGNILLADPSVPGGRPVVKLADFGIAHLVGSERITTIGTVIGTAGYLSPEQIYGGEPGPSADIYSLGLVVLEALTGVREYPGTPVEAVAARAARDPRIPASLPEDWRGLLGAMTARDPELRPNALEVAVMARELAPELEGWEPEAATVPLGDTAPTVVHPRGTAAADGAALAAGGEADATGTGATRLLPATRRRRRGILTGGVVAGSILAVAATLALGSMMAPASEEPQSVPTTPRPTPTVQAPPATVTPVDTTTEQPQQEDTSDQPVQQSGPAGGDKGKGKDKGGGPGKGHGGGPGKGKG